jgi:hypothetical protein
MNQFRYILRFTIEPGHFEDKRINGLISFCKTAEIDDVMFFINVEELNKGHLSLKETEPWLELISRIQPELESIGVTTSINPWITLLHADRGRKLKEGQVFSVMTDPYGNKAEAVVCPLCTEWRDYIKDMYSYYASIKPDILWVEDDFRLHNHPPLKWGGCFCDRHMEEYSKAAGRNITREEFVEGILATGNPHPYRKLWLDMSRDTMVDLAVMIGDSVHKVSPSTKVGLMSSPAAVHCAEGRDWDGILRGLSSGIVTMVNRPHLPAYSEVTPQNYLKNFSIVSMMTRTFVPKSTVLYPEIENFQYSRFSKSNNFTRFQLETSSCLNSSGITLSIYDQMGNGAMLQEGYQKILAESKKFLSSIKGLGLDADNQQGIKVPISAESSYTLHTREGICMTELYPVEGFWGGLLSCFGIANKFTTENRIGDSVVAISGQYLRNLDGAEIIHLFEYNFIIMEAEAVHTLYDMGYGYLAGVNSVKWHRQDSGHQSYEEVCDGNNYCGIDNARMSAQVSAGDYLEIEYVREPELKTVLKNPSGEIVGAGMAVYEGHVLILPYGKFGNDIQAHLSPVRQEILQEILKSIPKYKCPVFVKGLPHVPIYAYGNGKKNVLMLFNSSGDDIEEVEIYAPEGYEDIHMEIDRLTGKLKEIELTRKEGCIVLKNGLKNMELKVLL